MRRSPSASDEPSLETRLSELDAQLRRFEGALRAQQQSHGRARSLELELASVVERASAAVRDLGEIRGHVQQAAQDATRDALADSAARVQEFEQRAARILDAYATAVRAAQQAVARAEARIDAFDERVARELSQASREIREAALLVRERSQTDAAAQEVSSSPMRRLAPALLAAALLLAGFAGYNWLARTLRDTTARADAAERQAEETRREANQQIASLERTAQQAGSEALAAAARANRVVTVLAAPDAERVPLRALRTAPGASGQVLWSPSRGVVVTASGLPALAAGDTYQVWLVTSREVVRLGLLTPDTRGGTTAAFDLPQAAGSAVRGFMITREPAGDAPRPSRNVLLAS